MTKLCIWIKLFTFKNTKVQVNWLKSWYRPSDNKNLGKNELKKFRFSSVSARKLKCPSLAQLGTFLARLGSSQKISARAHHYYIHNWYHDVFADRCKKFSNEPCHNSSYSSSLKFHFNAWKKKMGLFSIWKVNNF